MKKSLMIACGALALAAFAEPAAPAPGCPCAGAPNAAACACKGPCACARPDRPPCPNGGFQMPTMFTIDGNTTADQIAELKQQFNDKVDAAFAAQAAKTGDDKKPTTVIYLVNEGGFGLGGMGPQGFGCRRGGEGKCPGMAPGCPGMSAPNCPGMAGGMMPPPPAK